MAPSQINKYSQSLKNDWSLIAVSSSSSLKSTPPAAPLAPIGSGFGSNGRRKPSRPPQPPKKQQSKGTKAAAASSPTEEAPGLLSGYHDMSNVETWVSSLARFF